MFNRPYHGKEKPIAIYFICAYAAIVILSDSMGKAENPNKREYMHVAFMHGTKLYDVRWCKVKYYKANGLPYIKAGGMTYFIKDFQKVI